MNRIVGNVSDKFSKISNRKFNNDKIFIGDENINHIKMKHPTDYNLYFNKIENIISNPNYIAISPKDGSLEYVKEIFNSNTGSYVKVAVRVSGNGKYFVRSLYTLNNNRVLNFVKKGKMIDYNSI